MNPTTPAPFALAVRGDDHHHDRSRDAAGRTPADVAAGRTFLGLGPAVLAALDGDGYAPSRASPHGCFRVLTPKDASLPSIEVDVPLDRVPDGALGRHVAAGLRGADAGILSPPCAELRERRAAERCDAAFSALARAIGAGRVPVDDPSFDSAWIHAATPWSRAVLHCRSAKGVLRSLPLPDASVPQGGTLIVSAEPDRTSLRRPACAGACSPGRCRSEPPRRPTRPGSCGRWRAGPAEAGFVAQIRSDEGLTPGRTEKRKE